jgi:phosphatidylglycerophosphate synthase
MALALTAHAEPWSVRLLLIAGALGMQFRLIANLLDGMVAIASGKASAVGELYNEIPDRISDIALFIGAGYAAGGHAALGYIAAVAAVMTAYIRATGKAAGATNLYGGPMAKQHRMFVMTLVCIYLAITPASLQPIWNGHGLMALGLLIVIIGAVITCIRRLLIIVATLKGKR